MLIYIAISLERGGGCARGVLEKIRVMGLNDQIEQG
jgi:hypothetical protein